MSEITKILIDGFDELTGYYYGHDDKNEPTVDFKFFIDHDVEIGKIYQVKIIDYVNRNFIVELYEGE